MNQEEIRKELLKLQEEWEQNYRDWWEEQNDHIAAIEAASIKRSFEAMWKKLENPTDEDWEIYRSVVKDTWDSIL